MSDVTHDHSPASLLFQVSFAPATCVGAFKISQVIEVADVVIVQFLVGVVRPISATGGAVASPLFFAISKPVLPADISAKPAVNLDVA
jgi:hypothetical protein